jgi:thiol-disulfide isomerase/thioredoxin
MKTMAFLGTFLALAAPFAGPVAAGGEESSKLTAIGEKIGNSNSLRDLRGNRRSLNNFAGNKALVLVFLGTDCPISKSYIPSLIELEKNYRPKQVQFLAVYPNEQEDLDQLASHAYDMGVPFLVVKDSGHRLAALVGAKRVPTVAVLDGDSKLRYRGRIDDRYGASSRRQEASRADLSLALDEVLAGKQVTVAETEVDGCLLQTVRKQPTRTDVTYAKDVAPIIQNRCQACHRDGQGAPFTLLSFDDAVQHAEMIREVITERRMPPWQADSRYGHFSNDRRLTRDELDTFTAWLDSGLKHGDAKDLPKPKEWPVGWSYGKPDMVLSMPEDFTVPADGVVPYQNWIIETNFKEDRWVKAAEGRPGTPSVVHHLVVYIMKEGQRGPIAADGSFGILVGWAPGDLGLMCPPDTALRIPKGAKLRFEMHYTPCGKATKDRSSVGIIFADKPPKNELLLSEFANTYFEVPANSENFKAEAAFRFRDDARIVSFAPHMHWRGKDYHYEVIYPDGKKETLLSVPRWDFNWQNVYRFEEPLKMPKGAMLHSVAHWDNSAANPLNPDPKKSAKFGLQTWEEMMVGFVAYVWERPETAEELAKNPPSQADLIFDRFDVNGDDFITPDEIPERMKVFLLASGTKLPEKLSREEFRKLFEEMRKRFPPKKPESKPDGNPQP